MLLEAFGYWQFFTCGERSTNIQLHLQLCFVFSDVEVTVNTAVLDARLLVENWYSFAVRSLFKQNLNLSIFDHFFSHWSLSSCSISPESMLHTFSLNPKRTKHAAPCACPPATHPARPADCRCLRSPWSDSPDSAPSVARSWHVPGHFSGYSKLGHSRIGWFPTMITNTKSLLGWRPSLVGWRPLNRNRKHD